MSFRHPYDNIDALSLCGLRARQHCISLADAWRGAKENA